MAEKNIESLLNEQRVFPPSPEFSKAAHIKTLESYESICRRAPPSPFSILARSPSFAWRPGQASG